MELFSALLNSFFYGITHGILPDEYIWPILFCYAVGGASGRTGVVAAFYFSTAFTIQRMIISQLSYLSFTSFLFNPGINTATLVILGIFMTITGLTVIRNNRYRQTIFLLHRSYENPSPDAVKPQAPPAQWMLVHGFVSGFGFKKVSLYVNTIAAPSMPSVFLGFLPGLLYGLGTMVSLLVIGYFFGIFLNILNSFSKKDIQQLGAFIGNRILFYGGVFFSLLGLMILTQLIEIPLKEKNYILVILFIIVVVIPVINKTIKNFDYIYKNNNKNQ